MELQKCRALLTVQTAECHSADCHSAVCHSAQCDSAECHSAGCHSAEYNFLNEILPSIILMIINMLHGILLYVIYTDFHSEESCSVELRFYQMSLCCVSFCYHSAEYHCAKCHSDVCYFESCITGECHFEKYLYP
jgi:hypothetical protein